MRKLQSLLLLTLLILVGAPAVAQGGVAYMRVANFSPDAPTLDVYVDGQHIDIPPLQPAQLSTWITVPPGQHQISFVQAGADPSSTVVGPFGAAMVEGGYYLLPVVGSGTDIYAVLIQEQPTQPIPSGSIHLTSFNSIPGSPIQDVLSDDGRVLASGVGFGQALNVDIPAGQYNLRMAPTASDERGFRTGNVNLTEGVFYLLGLIRGRSGNGLIIQQVLPQNAFPPTQAATFTPRPTDTATEPPTETSTPTVTPTETATLMPIPPTNTPRPLEGTPLATAIPLTPVVIAPTATQILPTATLLPTDTPTATLTAVPPTATVALPTFTPTAAPTATHSGPPDLVDAIMADPRLTIMTRGIEGVELVDALRAPGRKTVFAPTDQAWRDLLTEYPDLLPNSDAIRNVLRYHIVDDTVPTVYIFDQMDLLTEQGGMLHFAKNGDAIGINSRARVLNSDIETANGLLYVIDAVLIPPDMLPGSSNNAPQG